jgi:SAM-dependent methyltransferase
LPFPADCVDIVLLLGPLYHLVSAADRTQALEEAARVLRPGGLLFAAAITRWAYALYGLKRDHLFADPTFEKKVLSGVRDGHHRGDSGNDYFTTAYFHRPEELQFELASAGFVVQGCYGLEGPCGLLADFDERWNDLRRRAEMIRITEMIESEPSLLGVNPHLLAVARRL